MDWLDVTVWIRKKIEWIRKRTASIVSGSFFSPLGGLFPVSFVRLFLCRFSGI